MLFVSLRSLCRCEIPKCCLSNLDYLLIFFVLLPTLEEYMFSSWIQNGLDEIKQSLVRNTQLKYQRNGYFHVSHCSAIFARARIRLGAQVAN